MARPVEKLLDDILAAIAVGDEIVRRGQKAFYEDPVLQYGAEAVIGHIGDAASKLPTEVSESIAQSGHRTPPSGWLGGPGSDGGGSSSARRCGSARSHTGGATLPLERIIFFSDR